MQRLAKHSRPPSGTSDRRAADWQPAEVHAVLVEDFRPWRGWRYVAGTTVVVAIAAILLAPSLLSSRAGAPRSGRVSVAVGARCVRARAYGGLGARASVFDANNDNSTAPAGPTPGAAWFFVTATAGGCVTAFSLRDAGSPPLTARALLFLISNPLPRDAERIASAGRCAIWRSAWLQRATGHAYAVATAIPQVGGAPGMAEIEVTSHPTCRWPGRGSVQSVSESSAEDWAAQSSRRQRIGSAVSP
jgi:hypothetical protein